MTIRLSNKIVIRSTSNSIQNKNISLLAIVESVLAVVIYWWVAVYFQTHLHLVISVFAAPLLLLRSIRSCEYAKSWWSPKHLNATERFDAEFPRLKFLVALGSFTVLTSVVISYWIYHYKFSNLSAIREQLEALPLFSVFLLNLMIFLSSLVLSTLTKYKFRVTSIKSSIFRYSLLLGITASSFSLAFFTFVLDSWIPITSATVAATFIFFYILIVNNSKGWPDPINANADDLAILFVRTAIGIFLMLLLLSYKYGLVTLMIAMSVLLSLIHI